VGSLADYFMERSEEFQKMYPFITIKGLSMNTVKSVNRILTEYQAGRVTIDMFTTSDDAGFTLAQQGALQKPVAPFPHLKDFDPRLQPASGLFMNPVMTPRIQGAYNTELVAPEEVPISWEEVASPRWKGKVIISASAEEVPGRMAYMWRKDGEMNWDDSFDFWRKIRAQEPLVSKGFRRGAEQIAAGEKAIVWQFPPGPPSMKAIYDNAPIRLIAFPTFWASFTVEGVIKGAPHPNAAWLFMDYVTSPAGQQWYTEVVSAKLPLNPKAKPGVLAQFLIEQGGVMENSEVSDPNFTLDTMGAVIFDPANAEKSEDFFLKLMGVR
jgi:iron(III) transport system substrate-binding protein